MAKKRKNDEDLNSYERAAKAADKLSKILTEQGDILENNRGILDSITETFNVKTRDFYASIKRTQDQTKALQEEIKNNSINLSDSINSSFSQISSSLYKKNGNLIKDISRGLKDLSKIDFDLAAGLTDALKSGDLSKFWDDFGEDGMKAFQKLVQDKKGFDKFSSFVTDDAIDGWKKQQQEIDEMARRLQSAYEKVFSFRKTITTIGEYFTRDFMPKIIFEKLYDFDQILNDTQKEFGLAMDKNKAKFSELVGQTQIFGLSTKDTAELMGKLGENLRTTNFLLLSTAAKDMAAIGQATGLSVDEMSQLGTQMMFYGKTSKDVAKFTEQTMQMAQKYGLNAKKVLQDFTKALPTMRALGWQGGEKALRDMVLQAQKLGQNMDDLTASAKKLRTLEGSIEASADLALVGVNTNAIQMLAAARRGGKEFSSFISDLTKGIGQIKKDGTVDFDPVDIDRLNVISESIGIPLEKLQDQIALTAQRNAKVDLFPSSMFNNLKPEEQEFLLNAAKIGEGGKIELDASILGTKDLSKVSSSLIEGAMSQKKALEEQAKENTSFQDSVKNLKQSIYNIFTHLQPIIEGITKMITGFNTWLNGFSETTKKWIAAGIAFSAVVFSVAKNWMSGYWMGVGFNSAVNKGGFLSGFGKLMDKFNPVNWFKKAQTVVPTPGGIGGGAGGAAAGTAGRGIGTFAESLKAMPSPAQLLSLAAAIAAVGVAFVGIGYGIKLAASGISELVQSFNGITNAGYALGAVVAIMGGFVGMLGIMIPLVGALGTASTAGALGLLALGAAFVGIGFGIKLAADGLANLVSSFSGLKDSSAALWSIVAVMGSFVAVSALLIPELAALGTSLAVFGTLGWAAVPPMLALGAAGIALGYGIKLAGEGISYVVKAFGEFATSILKTVSSTPQLIMMSGALMALAPALLAFGAAGIISAPGILAVSLAFGILAPSIAIVTPALEKLSKISSDALTNVGKSFSGLSLGLIALSGVGVLFPLLALASGAIGLLVPALNMLIPAVSTLSKIDTGVLLNISSALASSVPSLLLFSTLGFVSPLLIGASAGLGVLGKALTYFSELKITNLSNIIQGVSDSAASLIKFSAVGLFSPAIILASGALGALGMALSHFSNVDLTGIESIKKLSSIVPSLVVFSAIGILSAPILLGAGVLALLGNAIPKFVNSLSDLQNIKTDGIENLNQSLIKFIPSLIGLSMIGVLAIPIFAGATMLMGAGTMLQKAGVGFINFANLNWNSFKNLRDNSDNLIISLLKLSTLSIMAAPILVGATMLSGAGIMLGLAANGFNNFSKVNFSGLTNFSKIIPEFILSLTKLSVISVIAAPVMLGAGMLAVAGVSLGIAAKGFDSLSQINFGKLSGLTQGVNEIFKNVLKLSIIGSVAPLIILAGTAIGLLGAGLSTLSNLSGFDSKSISESISNLTPALTKFSLIGLLAAPLILASSALGLFGLSFAALSKGVAQASGIDWSILNKAGDGLTSAVPSLLKFSLLGILSAPIMLGATALALVGKSMLTAASGFLAMSNVDWSNIDKIGGSISNLLPSLVGFGLKGLVAAPGIYLMNSTISSLANTMERLANPLDLANESLGSMSENIVKLKSAIQGLDTSKLNNLADFSDKFVSASSSVIVANAPEAGESKAQKITLEPIHINLKLNGKDVQEIIIKDTAYHA